MTRFKQLPIECDTGETRCRIMYDTCRARGHVREDLQVIDEAEVHPLDGSSPGIERGGCTAMLCEGFIQ